MARPSAHVEGCSGPVRPVRPTRVALRRAPHSARVRAQMPLAYLPKDLATPYPTGLSDEDQGLLHRKKMTRFLFENRPAMWGPSPTLYLDFDKKEKDAYVRIEQGMLAEITAKIAEV